MKNKKTQAIDILNDMFLETESFKNDVISFKRKKIPIIIKQEISVSKKKAAVIDTLRVIEAEMQNLTDIVIHHHETGESFSSSEIEKIQKDFDKQESYINETINQLKDYQPDNEYEEGHVSVINDLEPEDYESSPSLPEMYVYKQEIEESIPEPIEIMTESYSLSLKDQQADGDLNIQASEGSLEAEKDSSVITEIETVIIEKEDNVVTESVTTIVEKSENIDSETIEETTLINKEVVSYELEEAKAENHSFPVSTEKSAHQEEEKEEERTSFTDLEEDSILHSSLAETQEEKENNTGEEVLLESEAQEEKNIVDLMSLISNSKSVLALKINDHEHPLNEDLAYLDELEQDDEIVDEIDIELMPIFLEGCADLIPEIEDGLKHLLENTQEDKEDLYRNLHTLKGNVGMVGALRARREVHTLESAMQRIKDGRTNAASLYEELNERFHNILLLIDSFNEGDYTYRLQTYEILKLKEKINDSKDIELKEIENLEAKDKESKDDVDETLLEFLFEDTEIFKTITNQIKEMQYGETDLLRSLTNNLHSIKGSLGTVGYNRAKTEVHEMEDFFKEYLFDKKDNPEQEIERLNTLKDISYKLMDRMDNINQLIEEVQKGNVNYRIPSFKLMERRHLYNRSHNVAVKDIHSHDVEYLPKETEKKIKEKSVQQTLVKKTAVSNATNKPFKIPVDIMSRLITEINEAGLVRSGLLTSAFDNQNLLKEFEENLDRLKRMLRELEIHAESQIQSRKSQIEESGEDFDPLELDRFTRLQELTRFLTEGVNDIFDIHQLMSKISNNQETMLASQERSINEVQETLGRTRLVPFSTVSSVFERVVMLTQKEVGKNIDFRIEGEATEIDGTLIDKLKTPLEHILRNAISHGIETPEERESVGKNTTGKVTIYVSHHSGKIYITVKDDGAGIKIEKVRRKAIDKGLWEADKPMTATQAADMICLPNFSTADKLSEIAGRGVGMDAVRNSVFALGGNFELHSTEGEGLVVNMQVPTTIATIGALICQIGDEKVAMPVDIVDNVFMIKAEELFEAYNKGYIHYINPLNSEDRVIDFRFMLDVMGLSNGGVLTPKDIKKFNHIAVVKSEGQFLAVLVDEILGVREVPLRPASTLLAALPGVIGVTILNDGKAGYVMDIIRAKNTLLRELNITITKEQLMPPHVMNAGYNVSNKERIGKPLVLVVDDSLTVRKATERFLHKSGFDYALAKDGQDALEMLSSISPDLILLDVEMPRMDGFEFAKHVREHHMYSEVPIIMITSRIAEKHKTNAMAIGVNEYTGKPFKEEEMLELMHKYI